MLWVLTYYVISSAFVLKANIAVILKNTSFSD